MNIYASVATCSGRAGDPYLVSAARSAHTNDQDASGHDHPLGPRSLLKRQGGDDPLPQDGLMPTLRSTELDTRAGDDVTSSLVTQVARVGSVDLHVLERVRHEVLSAAVPWQTEYGSYQSGGWWTASLMNGSGDCDDVLIRDCEPIPTELLRRLPATRRLLEGSGLSLMWVRLARLEPNSFLWEHRDYVELQGAPRHRLHIPLVTNPSAFLVTGGTKVALSTGHVWRLQPTYAHGACNLIGPDRIHLVADVYGETTGKAHLDPGDVHALATPSAEETNCFVKEASRLASLGFVEAAERSLLRLFYRYRLGEGQVYELVIEMHDRLGRPQAVDRWRNLQAKLLERVVDAQSENQP